MNDQIDMPFACAIIKDSLPFCPKPTRGKDDLIWKIGWNHTRTVHVGMTLSPAQLQFLLEEDLRINHRLLREKITIPLSPMQMAVLSCIMHIIGLGSMERSRMVRLLNRGWFSQVPASFLRASPPRDAARIIPLAWSEALEEGWTEDQGQLCAGEN